MLESLKKRFHPRNYSRISHVLLLLYCLTAAISIALSQIFLLIVLASWLGMRAFYREKSSYRFVTKLSLPLSFWVGASAIAAIIGVNLSRAVPEVLKTSLYVLLPFAILDALSPLKREELITRVRTYLFAFIGGQVLAAFHSYASVLVGRELSPRIPGPVTESGQLVLVLSMVGGLLFFDRLSPRWERMTFAKNQRKLQFYAALVCLAVVVVCWPRIISLSTGSLTHLLLSAGLIASVVVGGALFARSLEIRFWDLCRHPFSSVTSRQFLLWSAGALLGATLILNLKRGPWLGCAVLFLFLGFFLSRKLLVGTVVSLAVVLLAFAPARERLFQYRNDFLISGGRANMWVLGAELSARYPLGIGPNNASFMRQLDPSLPPTHRHMHNNLLNVAVESGWFGLSAYLWWMFSVVSLGVVSWISSRRESRQGRALAALSLSLSAGLLGWQVAGLVEYNFGDGEIRMMAFFLMGVLLAIAESAHPQRA